MIEMVNNLHAPPRPADGHKGTFGTVIVVGGSETMIGAPALCARAALRTGVGLVKVACPPNILPHVLTIEPSATGIAIGNEPDDMLAQLEQADPDHKAVLAVGPGMGQSAVRRELVDRLLIGDRTIVLDADGLNLLAQLLKIQGYELTITAPLVVTPHPGEYRRLADVLNIDADPVDPDRRKDAASQLARKLNATVVLKGQHSVITNAECFAINPTGNPALATAGSGDILTGMIASLIAQGMLPFDAARLAAYVHGNAADQWAKQHGERGLRAIELADQLPQAFAQF
jgi:NAD(P)H-hydrate epimerase